MDRKDAIRRFESFTLIEMLVTLTIFSITMIVIYNLLATSLRFMQTISGEGETQNTAIILGKVLEKTLRDSYMASETNGAYLVDAFDDKRYLLLVEEKVFYISELNEDEITRTQSYNLEGASDISLSLLSAGERRALDLLIEFDDKRFEKLMLLGYQAGTSAK